MSRHRIELLLLLYRQALAANRVTYRRRPKNLNTMAELGLLPSDVYKIAANLCADDALRDVRPNRHEDFPEESVGEFGIVHDNRDIYIKLTAIGTDDGAHAVLISFHFAELPFDFLFK